MAIQYSPGQQTFYQPDWKYSALPGAIAPMPDWMLAMAQFASVTSAVAEHQPAAGEWPPEKVNEIRHALS
jgi:hypothetical protein